MRVCECVCAAICVCVREENMLICTVRGMKQEGKKTDNILEECMGYCDRGL